MFFYIRKVKGMGLHAHFNGFAAKPALIREIFKKTVKVKIWK